jgi:hypothetical protein
MVNMYQLWIPIVLSAVLVFLASSVIWMVLPYHRKDVTGVTDENALADALRKQKLAPGQYFIPFTADPAARQSPEFKKKMTDGPQAMITIKPVSDGGMGGMLIRWFIYSLILSSVVAYVSGRTLQPGASYLAVFRVVGTVAWLGYGGAHAVYSIFWGRPWRSTLLDTWDALVYGLLTAGAFGWRWPHG